MQMRDADGSEVLDTGGYRYFGAARELPGVREAIEKDERKRKRLAGKSVGTVGDQRSHAELYRSITADYYAFKGPVALSSSQVSSVKARCVLLFMLSFVMTTQ
jgi:hypothetical protein